MRTLIIFILFFLPNICLAYDCTTTKPFKLIEKQKAIITVTKISWLKGEQHFTDICKGTLDFEAFDVRDR
jgi:hypothetical protein